MPWWFGSRRLPEHERGVPYRLVKRRRARAVRKALKRLSPVVTDEANDG